MFLFAILFCIQPMDRYFPINLSQKLINAKIYIKVVISKT